MQNLFLLLHKLSKVHKLIRIHCFSSLVIFYSIQELFYWNFPMYLFELP